MVDVEGESVGGTPERVAVDWALEALAHGVDEMMERAVGVLIHADHPDIEPRLLKLYADERTKFRLSGVASRILIERNPDRDPAFLIDRFSTPDTVSGKTSVFTRLASRVGGDVPPEVVLYTFGLPRLRSAHPIEIYTRLLDHRFSGARITAAIALGDSADLDALTPLAAALGDKHPMVRLQAADAVRRLRHSGTGRVLATHEVRKQLIRCLSDRKRKVRIAAARALASMDNLDPLRQTRRRHWRDRREMRRILRGDIPPLPKIWPGDETT